MAEEGISRFGTTGLIVPATSVLSPPSYLARAKALASASSANVRVERCARSADRSPLETQETYQVMFEVVRMNGDLQRYLHL